MRPCAIRDISVAYEDMLMLIRGRAKLNLAGAATVLEAMKFGLSQLYLRRAVKGVGCFCILRGWGGVMINKKCFEY
eukprot:764219-Hanusia_phi.AAC.3